jgi:hypothetical protein
MLTEELQKTFQTIQTYLKNDEWVKSQDPELVNAISDTEVLIHSLTQQLYIFLDCFEQYAHALEATVRVPAYDLTSDSREWSDPTQTSAERDERDLA